jgi:hypothetical protein
MMLGGKAYVVYRGSSVGTNPQARREYQGQHNHCQSLGEMAESQPAQGGETADGS